MVTALNVSSTPLLSSDCNTADDSGASVNQLVLINRSKRPVIEFDKDGNVLQAWGADIMTGPHGIKVDAHGYIWTVDRTGQVVFKLTPLGRVLMTIGRVGYPLGNDSRDGFHDPTAIAFAPPWDSYALHTQNGLSQTITAGNAFANPAAAVGRRPNGRRRDGSSWPNVSAIASMNP